MKYFVYAHGSVSYRCQPQFTVTGRGRIFLLGLYLYNKEDRYMGFWQRDQIPMRTVYEAEAFVKEQVEAARQEAHKTMNPIRRRHFR